MENEETKPADPRLARLIEIQRELDLRKALYAEYDRLVLELQRDGFISAEVEGLVLSLIDHFADCNTGWTSAAVKRFEVKIEPRERVEKRRAKAAKAGN